MIENLLKKKRTSILIVRWKLILHESTSSDWHKNSYIYIINILQRVDQESVPVAWVCLKLRLILLLRLTWWSSN